MGCSLPRSWCGASRLFCASRPGPERENGIPQLAFCMASFVLRTDDLRLLQKRCQIAWGMCFGVTAQIKACHFLCSKADDNCTLRLQAMFISTFSFPQSAGHEHALEWLEKVKTRTVLLRLLTLNRPLVLGWRRHPKDVPAARSCCLQQDGVGAVCVILGWMDRSEV